MKGILVLLALACAFALSGLWQTKRIEGLRAQRERAARLAEGRLAQTPSGLLPPGRAVLIVGAPSGAEPLILPEEPAGRPRGPRGASDPAVAPRTEPGELGDFVMEVQPGHTLSEIAHAHYGSAPADLVQSLARYNGLADPDRLRAGGALRLPPIERLDAVGR